MTNKQLTFLGIILLASCGRQTEKADEKVNEIHFDFPLANPKLLTSSTHSDIDLDSIQRVMWTDKIVPTPYYSATSLASFDKVNGFTMVAVETMADDWGKSFLLTLNESNGLIDFLEITDDFGDATQDEKGNETVVGTIMRTEFLPNSVFARTTINKTIYNYHEADELTEKDSIVEKFIIDELGRFKRLSKDSTRIRE